MPRRQAVPRWEFQLRSETTERRLSEQALRQIAKHLNVPDRETQRTVRSKIEAAAGRYLQNKHNLDGAPRRAERNAALRELLALTNRLAICAHDMAALKDLKARNFAWPSPIDSPDTFPRVCGEWLHKFSQAFKRRLPSRQCIELETVCGELTAKLPQAPLVAHESFAPTIAKYLRKSFTKHSPKRSAVDRLETVAQALKATLDELIEDSYRKRGPEPPQALVLFIQDLMPIYQTRMQKNFTHNPYDSEGRWHGGANSHAGRFVTLVMNDLKADTQRPNARSINPAKNISRAMRKAMKGHIRTDWKARY